MSDHDERGPQPAGIMEPYEEHELLEYAQRAGVSLPDLWRAIEAHGRGMPQDGRPGSRNVARSRSTRG
jgi:hypothetical protein